MEREKSLVNKNVSNREGDDECEKNEAHQQLSNQIKVTQQQEESQQQQEQSHELLELLGKVREQFQANASAKLFHLPMSTVFCNVYDLMEANALLTSFGVGMHHAGIEVYGVEYAFGRDVVPEQNLLHHNCQASTEVTQERALPSLHACELNEFVGVVAMPPRSCPPHIFREQFVLGSTMLSSHEVELLLANLRNAEEWQGNTYHLIRHNCLHFAEVLAHLLIPPQVRCAQLRHKCNIYISSNDNNNNNNNNCCCNTAIDQRKEVHLQTKEEEQEHSLLQQHHIHLPPITVYECPYTEVCELSDGRRVQLPKLFPPHLSRICRLSVKYLPVSLIERLNNMNECE